LHGGAALSVLLKRESQGDFAADYSFDAIVSKISASTTVGVPSLSARCGAVGITPEMPVAESEQGLRPIRSRVREQRSALLDQASSSTAGVVTAPVGEGERSTSAYR